VGQSQVLAMLIPKKAPDIMPKVFIVILNWNGVHDTLECLDSLARLAYPAFEVIVVDNGSADDSVATIRRRFPHAMLVENDSNLGFTGGNNVGAKRALELGADYVWLLNNDTVVEPDSLGKLVQEAERSPEIGLLSPVINEYDAPGTVQFMGAYVPPGSYRICYVDDPKELDDEQVRGNLILFGTALLIKRRVIETIGLLSEKYFAYYEDNDYSLRASRGNFRNKVVIDAHIRHKGCRSTGGKNSPVKAFLMARNAYFFWRDNAGGTFLPASYVGMMIGYAKYLSDEGNPKAYDACLAGIYAAFKGRGGAHDPALVAPFWLRAVFSLFVGWHPYLWIDLFKGNIRGIFSTLKARAANS
jgi:GT2 family glycosyltransferase